VLYPVGHPVVQLFKVLACDFQRGLFTIQAHHAEMLQAVDPYQVVDIDGQRAADPQEIGRGQVIQVGPRLVDDSSDLPSAERPPYSWPSAWI
jgi:hypothetical protein